MDGSGVRSELHDEKAQYTVRAGEWSDRGGSTRPRWQLIPGVASGSRKWYLCEGRLKLLLSIDRMLTRVVGKKSSFG